VRRGGIIYCMEFQSSPSSMFPLPQGERMGGEGAKFYLRGFKYLFIMRKEK